MSRPFQRWFHHPDHGYMLRRAAEPFDGVAYDDVVVGLCANDAEAQADAALWGAHKSRLHVNAGSGFLVVETDRREDRNPAFVSVPVETVPAWIVADFTGALA